MKLIGLLGGTSWPSTLSYYEMLNRAAQECLGSHHSARILLYSIDYDPIKSLYHHGWDKIPELIRQEIQYLLEKKPDCLIICNNTLHRAFDQIGDRLHLTIPIFHAGRLSAEEAQRNQLSRVLLLGTAFTMEDGFFAQYFEEKGIQVATPSAEDRRAIQVMQSEIARGSIDKSYGVKFADIISKSQGAEAVVLACTEIPLVVTAENSPLPIINPSYCQCAAAAKFAFH